MNPKMIIASILVVFLGWQGLMGGVAWAHHPAEPCSTDPAVLATGSVPKCTESPNFDAKNKLNDQASSTKEPSMGVFIAVAVGAAFFAVFVFCSFSNFSLNCFHKHEKKQ